MHIIIIVIIFTKTNRHEISDYKIFCFAILTEKVVRISEIVITKDKYKR